MLNHLPTRSHFVFTILVLVVCIGSHAEAALISAEPDNYDEGTYIPENIGVLLRDSSYPPGHPNFNDSWRRAKAMAPVATITCQASTGSRVMGFNNDTRFNGQQYGLRAWFTSPTNYLGFDMCWSNTAGWSTGARVEVFGNDINGNQITLLNRVYRETGLNTYTSFSMFQAGITHARITCWDDPTNFRQMMFSIDAFNFASNSGTAFAVQSGNVLEAPGDMDIGADDSLRGNGTVAGNVNNAGTVNPGLSPGSLTIDGDYTQDPTGQYLVELGGTAEGEFDALIITGAAALDGTLKIELDNFTPVSGDTFEIMTYASHSGRFSSVIPPTGLGYDLDYGPTALTLTIVPEPATLTLLTLFGLAVLRKRRRQ